MKDLNRYNVIGITGSIGVGKSYIASKIEKEFNANIIEVDNIRRFFLWESLEKESLLLREKIINLYKIENVLENYFFDRNLFTEKIFKTKKELKKINKICTPFFKDYIKKQIIKNKLNCIIWSNLIEDNYLDLIEHILLIDISDNDWHKLNNKNIELILRRKKVQSSINEKINYLKKVNKSFEIIKNE